MIKVYKISKTNEMYFLNLGQVISVVTIIIHVVFGVPSVELSNQTARQI